MQNPTSLWLEQARLFVQCGWFALFGVALWLSVLVFYRPSNRVLFATARSLWALAMAVFIAMWLSGVVVEMLRRATRISGIELVLALGAFSVLLGGTLSLVREWFGAKWSEPIKSERVALSIGVLTLAGWWFGGMGLEWNALWNFAPADYGRVRAPDGWALSLGGAALLGASRMVRAKLNSGLRVKNPRAATWWSIAAALFLALPAIANNPAAASVFLVGAGAFGVKIWRSRPTRPVLVRVNKPTRAVAVLLVAALPLLYPLPDTSFWTARLMQLWTSPVYVIPFAILVVLLLWLGLGVREALRLAIYESVPRRALLLGTLAGAFASTVLFGPAGPLFWTFWPLAGLFFDLLAPHESDARVRTPQLSAEAPPADAVAS